VGQADPEREREVHDLPTPWGDGIVDERRSSCLTRAMTSMLIHLKQATRHTPKSSASKDRFSYAPPSIVTVTLFPSGVAEEHLERLLLVLHGVTEYTVPGCFADAFAITSVSVVFARCSSVRCIAARVMCSLSSKTSLFGPTCPSWDRRSAP
jgi:hypothetical protein